MKDKRVKIIWGLALVLIIVVVSTFFYKVYYHKKIDILKVELKDENILLKLSDDGACSLDDKTYVKSNEKDCILPFKEDIKAIYLKNKYDVVNEIKYNSNLAIVDSIDISNKDIYLAIGGTEKINYSIKSKGKVSPTITSSDVNVASIDENGLVKGMGNGNATITIKALNKEEKVNVLVTDFITVRPPTYNFDREYIGCNMYTKEQNDLLDKILENRVNKGGYLTRAGAVEAVRFFALEFPYRVAYFSENGRLDTYGVTSKVDGEGRYYHKGLYLNESRYANVTPTMHGPGTWGCQIYSNPSHGYRANGFDCSGFISWIIHQAGFENEDIGAGVSSYQDMTDLGVRKNLVEALNNNTLKVGDLLSGKGADGGHIAFVAGKKGDEYYVAESLWFGTGYFGSLIRTYQKDELPNYFYWQVDMDSYYKQDGNLTDYWM